MYRFYAEVTGAAIREIDYPVPNFEFPLDALLDAITPQPALKRQQDAAIVLLSYFFETCDIYEDPNLL